MDTKALYDAYAAKCAEKGIEPLDYALWKGPQRFSMDKLMHHMKGDEELTKQEAAKVLGYQNAAPVSNAIRNGYLEKDGDGGVTDESVHAYKKRLDRKRAVSAVPALGMTQKRYDELKDTDVIAMTKKTFEAVVRMKAEEAARAAEAEALSKLPVYGVDELAGAV